MSPQRNAVGTTDQAKQPRRRDPKGTRERLVRAALELFTTQGYHASTTPQVARKAGVAEGTIYRHFASKEQLLNDIYCSSVKLFSDVVQEAPKTGSCKDQMTKIAERWKEIASEDPALVKLVFVNPPTILLEDKSRDTFERLRGELEKVIASGKASGEIRPGPAYLWTEVWIQLVSLMLERVAGEEWAAQHTAPQQVVESAWDAIANPNRAAQVRPQRSAAGFSLGR
ncbi:MAG: TetR/AcrR family transcriptional regulator [Gemmatimonadota bacterium]|nr:TetR/AcrR family transcriptional regulator [Gemmatimonadota bacterium]